MLARSLPVFLFALVCGPTGGAPAEELTAREVAFHGCTKAVELKLGETRSVLCPQASPPSPLGRPLPDLCQQVLVNGDGSPHASQCKHAAS